MNQNENDIRILANTKRIIRADLDEIVEAVGDEYGKMFHPQEGVNWHPLLEEIIRTALEKFVVEEETATLRAEAETERIRHAACGVLAMSNTPETLEKNREMNAEYLSESVQDVIRCVEENISLRAEVERLKQCEAIVRELAESGLVTHYMSHINTARQWVKKNIKD